MMARQVNDLPSKFKVFKSTLIKPGPPDRYQLVPKKESLDGEDEQHCQLRRWTYGEKDPKTANKTVLMVGRRGTGQETFINALLNYVLGVEVDDKVWFEIARGDQRSRSESEPPGVTVYQISGCEGRRVPYSLTLVDTPGFGFGDGGGIEKEGRVADKLHDLFRSEKGIREIDAMCIVVTIDESRPNNSQRYVINTVVDLFGKDVERNIVLLLTNSIGRPRFLWKPSRLDNFFKFLEDRTTPRKLKVTTDVLRERVRQKACVGALKDRIELCDKRLNRTTQIQGAFGRHKPEARSDGSVTVVTVDEPYKHREEIRSWWDGKAVSCLACEETCHYPGCTGEPDACNPSEVTAKDERGVAGCASCRGRCSDADHVRGAWRYVTKTRKVRKTYEDVEKEYGRTQEEEAPAAGGVESVGSGLEEEIRRIEEERSGMVEEACRLVLGLEDTALNAYSRSVQPHLDFLLEKAKEAGDTRRVRKLREMKRRVSHLSLCHVNSLKFIRPEPVLWWTKGNT